jgi:hypothetical protein
LVDQYPGRSCVHPFYAAEVAVIRAAQYPNVVRRDVLGDNPVFET